MYLRKETKTIETGQYTKIPFCKDCNSEDIEIIKTCKHCESHNISYPSSYNMVSEDKPGLKPCTIDIDIYIFKCDNCGKEFEKELSPSVISFTDSFESVDYGDDYISFTLNNDYCKECMETLLGDLNNQINNVLNQNNIDNTVYKLFNQ